MYDLPTKLNMRQQMNKCPGFDFTSVLETPKGFRTIA